MGSNSICPLKFDRFRYPRVFYGLEKVVKVYDETEAIAFDTFKALKKSKGLAESEDESGENYFVAAYRMNDSRILTLTSHHVFIFKNT